MAEYLLKHDVLALERLSGGKLVRLRRRVNDIVLHNQHRRRGRGGVLGGGDPTSEPSPANLTPKEQKDLNNAIGEFCVDGRFSTSARTRFTRYQGTGDLLAAFADMSDTEIPEVCLSDTSFRAFLSLIRALNKPHRAFQGMLVAIMTEVLSIMESKVCKNEPLTDGDVQTFEDRLQSLSDTFETHASEFLKTMSMQKDNFRIVGQWRQGACLEEVNMKLQPVYAALEDTYGADPTRHISSELAQQYYKTGAFNLLLRTAMPFSGNEKLFVRLKSMRDPPLKYQLIVSVVDTINHLLKSLDLHQKYAQEFANMQEQYTQDKRRSVSSKRLSSRITGLGF